MTALSSACQCEIRYSCPTQALDMDNRVSFRLDAELARRLRAEAKQRKTTMTAIVKEAIRKEWERLNKQLPAPELGPKPKH